MTALFVRTALPSILAAAVIIGASSAASAKENYKFDPSGSTIGFSVHQFLGTTHGKFTSFSGRIEVDREHPENSSVTAQIEVRVSIRISKSATIICAARNFLMSRNFPGSHSKAGA